MKKRRELPCAQMRGKEQNSFAPGSSGFEVFKAVIDDDPRDIFFGVLRKKAKFRQLPAEMAIKSAQDAMTFGITFLGKGERQVAQAYTAQAAVKNIDDARNGDGASASQGARKRAERAHYAPHHGVFQTLAHAQSILNGGCWILREGNASRQSLANCRA